MGSATPVGAVATGALDFKMARIATADQRRIAANSPRSSRPRSSTLRLAAKRGVRASLGT